VSPYTDESQGHRLREEYERAKLRYIWAESEMTRQSGTAHGEDFNKLVRYVEEAKGETAEALRALESFESRHAKKKQPL
jgi:hypothetical protein